MGYAQGKPYNPSSGKSICTEFQFHHSNRVDAGWPRHRTRYSGKLAHEFANARKTSAQLRHTNLFIDTLSLTRLTLLSCRTSFHLWPGGGLGAVASELQFMMTSSGLTRRFSIPIFGCSPRPRKSPGGSILKFPIFSLCPSMRQKPYSSTSSKFLAFIAYIENVCNT